MDAKSFYNDIWVAKQNRPDQDLAGRDWFHRWLVDRLIDPRAHNRNEVALSLLQGGQRILDVGCWDGEFLQSVAVSREYDELFGVDIVESGVELAKQRGFTACVVDLNREPLPFPDGYFDGLTMLAVLEHLFDPFAVMSEVRRVLRPRGELIVAVPNVGSFTNRARVLFGRLPRTSGDSGWDGGHLHYFTKHALDRFLPTQGFDVVTRRATGGRPHLREWWLSLLVGELVYHCRRRAD